MVQVCCRGKVLWLLGAVGTIQLVDSGEPVAKHQLPPRSHCCPPLHVARNLALGYFYTSWAQLGCLGLFEEEASGYDIRESEGLCRFTLLRPSGDLAVLLDESHDVRQALMRLYPGAAWRPITSAICSLTTFVGLTEVPGLKLPEKEIKFAFQALVAHRIRQDASGKGCGGTLSLKSASKDVKLIRIQSLPEATEHSFFIHVAEADRTNFQISVEVRVMRKTSWQGEDGGSQEAYTFLGSTPMPCDIGTGATASSRLLQDATGMNDGVADETSQNVRSELGLYHRPWRRQLSDSMSQYVNRHLEFLQLSTVPREYDFRRTAPKDCALRLPAAAGLCGSSWALAAVGAFEKQMCRLSDGQKLETLSRQWILDCAMASSGCDGGSVEDAHAALLHRGAIAESCLQYDSGVIRTPAERPLGDRYCQASILGSCDRARRIYARHPTAFEVAGTMKSLVMNGLPTGATQWISGERAMSIAILSYGAVVATMDVYADFLAYRTGVYQQQSLDFQGKAAVQLIGWGIEPKSGTKFWAAEGNWGPKWGENQKFAACSIQDCKGDFCPADNGSPMCADSASWSDIHGYNCEWYTKHDPGCALFVDVGQRMNCRKSCKTCEAPALPKGEVCGFFRIQRGDNHCGIEELAAHAFVSVYSPSVELTAPASTSCADLPEWNDAYGRGCSWYAERSCQKYPDVGQMFNCPKTCGTCGEAPRVSRPGQGWAKRPAANGSRKSYDLPALHLLAATVIWSILQAGRHSQ